jgi:MFS family permease
LNVISRGGNWWHDEYRFPIDKPSRWPFLVVLNVLAALVFLVWPELPGLLLARVVSGLGVGVVTATATVWLAELDAARRPTHSPPRAQIIAAAANLGGLGLGGLIAGVLAQWAGHALTRPFLVLGGLMVLALLAISFAPETHTPSSPRPHYRPQRVSVPSGSRARFFAAATGAAITFARSPCPNAMPRRWPGCTSPPTSASPAQ